MKTTEPTFINLELSGNCSPLLFTSLACFCLQLSDTALWFRDCFSYATWKKRRAVIIIDQPIRFHFVRKLITRQHNVVNIDYFTTQSLLFFFLALFRHLKMTICNESNVLYMLESAIREPTERKDGENKKDNFLPAVLSLLSRRYSF